MKLRSIVAAVLLLLAADSVAQTARLSGAFVHVGYSSTDEAIKLDHIPSFMDELQDLRNDTIIIAQTRVSKNICPRNSGDFEWVKGFPDRLGVFLDEAHSRGMKVYVGTTLAGRGCANVWSNSQAKNAAEGDTAIAFSQVAAAYRNHPAFAGWYIPDEPGPVPAATHDYYRRITTRLKALAPGKPVAVAPYLGGVVSPSIVGALASSFRQNTGVDIQIWQDGIGARPEARLFHYPGTTPSIDEYYQALSNVLGTGLWADIELFNHGTPLFMQTGSGVSGAYRPASAQRVNQQLWSARLAAKRVSWLNQLHMSEYLGPGNGYREAPRLMGIYRAFYGLGNALLFPLNYSSYQWITPPSATYPDIGGNQLFDRRTGDPREPRDPAWVGINGSARVRIDLGSAKKVDWVGAHTLTYPEWGVRTPVSMDVYCGATASAMTKVGEAVAPFPASALAGSSGEEYVLSNRQPLGATCRFLELHLPNNTWTFISEIEASAE